MSERLRFQLCGRLGVTVGGARVEDRLPGRRGRLVLGYLVRHRHRPVSRDELIEAAWSDDPPGDPGAVLRPVLSRLRSCLGADRLPGTTQVRLVLDDEASIDVEDAVAGVHVAEALLARGEPQEAYGPAHVALYVGERPLLAGLEAPWLDEWREEHADVHCRALECCANVALAAGGSELAVGERLARRLIALAPFRENGHRLLMELLAARGEPAEALRAYETYRCLLRDELGTAPSPAIVAVHARLLGPG